MRSIIFGFVLLLAVVSWNEAEAKTDKVVCYYGSWAVYRNARGKFDVEDIDPRLCTHLIYTFVGLSQDGSIRVLDAWNDLEENWGKGAFSRFNRLKELNPGTKTLVAIGGWNEGSTTYSQVMSDKVKRGNFVKSALNLVLKYGFDGFDFDWEYPNQRGGKPEDVENFSKTLQELSQSFKPHGLLLSAAVAAAEFSASQSYNIAEISKHLDIINVMAYDLHGPWDQATGQNAPLYPSSIDKSEIEKQLNVITCIEYWLKSGADPSKVVLGMGTYGRTFTLNDASSTGLGSPATNPGNGGPYTNQPGMLGYNEIVELQGKGGWTVVWDDEQKVPYMYKSNQWVGYDNPESLTLKVEYAKQKGLGGAMIWSIETDDFHGLSGQTFPLLKAINSALGKNISDDPIPTLRPTSTTTSTTTVHTPTSGPIGPPGDDHSYLCTKQGYVRDPINCSIFYFCVQYDGKFQAIEFRCSDGLVFDPTTNVCDYPANVNCNLGVPKLN